ncbi:MAG: DUF1801 domain-containing protein [Balneolaceae bacterium]|nr:DUF1801 domain-containing protein [Balneolaceae bacterium]
MAALDDFLSKVPDAQKPLIKQLHNLITEALPSLESSTKWGNLTYHNDNNICSLVSHKRHVNLQIWNGATLEDSKNMLEGTGKRMRHIKIRDYNELDFSYVIRLLNKAVEEANT